VVMGYFDGNTVTALWTYAQHFAMSDNFYGTTFGPSTIGALNLAAGNTYPATVTGLSPEVVGLRHGAGTLVGDLDPTGDVCSSKTEPTVRLGSRNIGDLLNARGVTWGAFMGGFDLRIVNADGSTGCKRQSPASAANGGQKSDYVPHHAWFQYYASTANPEHAPPSAAAAVGKAEDGGARHQYDVHDFFDALAAGNLPAVSFMKAPAYADGHAGYSDPLLEQRFLVDTINRIMQSPFWKTTAIAITYDDSDGWYDHRKGPIVNPSALAGGPDTDNGDHLDGPGRCGRGRPRADAAGRPIQGRCGYGPRLPLIVISPFAKANFVDHRLTDQTSLLRFIEDNWLGGKRLGGGSLDERAGSITHMFDFTGKGAGEAAVVLDPETGEAQP
jgi:phospholipase C